MNERNYVSLALAVLFHDPAWKPWAVTKSIEGEGAKGLDKILRVLASKVGDECLENVRRLVSIYDKHHSEGREHERQALVLVGVLECRLRERGLRGEADIVRRAGEMIARGDKVVKLADTAASAADRLVLYSVEQAYKDLTSKYLQGRRFEGPAGARLPFLNPFHPKDRGVLEIPGKIKAETIAGYIGGYTKKVADYYKSAGNRKPLLLLNLAFLLLEPEWYRIAGKNYVPAADTRVPTHTVFDHLNASLATLLWYLHGVGEPKGCLAIVDLAGVQAWIQGARRLRDKWAASWLASVLAWKAVEPLVNRYGPGVLVSPPGRLHPLYTAMVASSTQKPHDLLKEAGFMSDWPLDPGPSSYLLSLPEKECVNLRNTVMRSLGDAWSSIIGKAVELASEVCQDKECPLSDSEIARLAGSVDPPLLARVIVSSLEQTRPPRKVLDEALQILDEELRGKQVVIEKAKNLLNKAADRLQRDTMLLAYFDAYRRLGTQRSYVSLSAGLAGPGYARLATRLYEAQNGKPRICTVCGRALAVVDGEHVSAGSNRSSAVAAEIGSDRLCPYCLVKRLTRRLILDEGLGKQLVGLDPSEQAREKLRWTTVDAYTSRASIARALSQRIGDIAVALVEDIIEGAKGDSSPVAAAEVEVFRLLQWLLKNDIAPSNSFLYQDLRKSILSKIDVMLAEISGWESTENRRRLASRVIDIVESLVLEALHDDTTWNAITKEDGNELKEFPRFTQYLTSIIGQLRRAARARVPIIYMDGDNVGKVLAGRLNLKPWEYASQVYRIKHTDDYALAASFVARALFAALVGEASREAGLEDLTTIPTPSYHFSVSRALAILAELDRRTVEGAGGAVIYAGGDDLVAVAPASTYMAELTRSGNSGSALTKKELTGIPALEVLKEARRHYWGSGFEGKAFAVLEQPSGDESRVALAFSPALAAYGRSGIVVYWRSKSPLWAGMGLAHRLLDEKDSVRTIRGANESQKDTIIVASDAAGAVPLPNVIPARAGQGQVARALSALEELVMAVERGRASRSLIYDIVQNSALINELTKEKRHGLAGALLESIFSRNTKGNARDVLLEIAKPLGGEKPLVETLIKVSASGGGELARLLERTGAAQAGDSGVLISLAVALAVAYRGVSSGL
ncbi:MAG: type III-B CRISPR-associated protein Cas10/Cmr2 [Desulfurococcales archaeon]|nr:type III-B CRISPR-associated protein Cas10/Cmr2 [Desulfurococcales archaeon]